MDQYYVNNQARHTGEHEVHKSTCLFLPGLGDREYVGYFSTSREALTKARALRPQVDGCKHCCPQSLTR